jgi:phospholipid/cholesterol/gamma-HCH transport system ATP-binding protein
MSSDPIIQARDLSVGWKREAVLKHATFDVHRGEIFGVLGRSGSGKTTLLRALVGLEKPLSGEVEITGMGAPVLEGQRPKFGVMFQQGALFGSMTVGENVALPLERWSKLPKDAILAMVRAKLRLVGLEQAEHKLPSALSGGMTKRAAIARAAGLDPITLAGLDLLSKTMRDALGLTVVVVTHELSSIFAIVDRCIVLDRETRGIIATGAPRELQTSSVPLVHDFFNRTAEAA